jgi:hypothetical protein
MARHIHVEDEELALTALKLLDPKIYTAVVPAARDRRWSD